MPQLRSKWRRLWTKQQGRDDVVVSVRHAKQSKGNGRFEDKSMTVYGHVWVCACRIAFDLSWEQRAFDFWSSCQEWGSSLFLQNVGQHLSGEVSLAVHFLCFSLKGIWNGCNFFISSISFLQVPLLLKICPCLFTFWSQRSRVPAKGSSLVNPNDFKSVGVPPFFAFTLTAYVHMQCICFSFSLSLHHYVSVV